MANLPLNFALICGGFFFILTVVGGLALILYSNRSKKKAGDSQQWPVVNGAITVSEVRQSTSTDEDGHISYSYYPYVEYNYTLNGQTFTSHQIAFGGMQGFNSPTQAQTLLTRYPVNTFVQVYYNPLKPGEAVLEKIAGGGAKTSKTIGIILLVISALIACPLIIGIFRNF